MKKDPVQIHIRKGALVLYRDQEYAITHVSQLDQVIARNLETGNLETLPVSELFLPKVAEKQAVEPKDRDLNSITTEAWEVARRRLSMIEPLLKIRERGSALAEKIAKEHGVSFVSLYRWRRDYLNSGLLSSLLPAKPNGGKGKPRLKDDKLEEAVRHAIDDYFLTDQKPSLKKTWEYLDELCRSLGIKTPHLNTLRKRISWRSQRDVVASRQGERAASILLDANEGQISDADWPLALIQVDHTELPVMIVDELNRRPIGRPWVTFSIDVFSRVTMGMYLSLDHPSAMSAGMCIAHSILPKEKWLADRQLEAEWPCWGVMGSLHMDNAREFRGNMLKAACEEYLIDLHLRPVKKPHYGAHIERLMGTVSEELKAIPGTTFANPGQKGEYDSEGNAIMTLAELERWLVFMLARYHHRVHSGIGTSPLLKYREGLLGGKGKPGRGLPARRLDEEKVRIDFMPFVERTVQDYGVLIDDIHYFSDVLRPWVNSPDPENPRAKRLFRFRRDPRDISQLYFFEPNAERYYAIPYRDLSAPPISLWEMREAKRRARQDGVQDIDEQVIFRYTRKMREEVAKSAEKTKAARRKQQKNIEAEKARQQRKTELPKVSASPKPTEPPAAIPGYDPSLVQAFIDDEDY